MSKDQNPTLVPRHQELQMVEARGQISVEELARHFSVSDDTIRRDLQELEKRKLLLRTHGGAASAALLVSRANRSSPGPTPTPMPKPGSEEPPPSSSRMVKP